MERKERVEKIKSSLSAEDVFTFEFTTASGILCTVIYADGITNKQFLGEQVLKPLFGYDGTADLDSLLRSVAFPEIKKCKDEAELCKEILFGNAALLMEGVQELVAVGVKTVPVRAISEPPTDIAVRGPREGFIEDIKTNMALVRKRLSCAELLFETVRVGKRSQTAIAVCYLQGIANEKIKDDILQKLKEIDVDVVPDSSYIAKMLSPRPLSLFKQVGFTEKPDIFTCKIAEGRVGIIVDGSPLAVTLPYMMIEDFQSAEDYYVSPYRATFTRFIRFFALIVGILLPAFYVGAQLFAIQIIPEDLLLKIAGSVRGLSLSPSMEMFATLLVLEILNEASIRMPKYVGMVLSIVGALVLGDAAVQAGILSIPTIIIIALSGICLYTVPNLTDSMSVLRILFVLIAGTFGPFGIVLFSLFVLYYLVTQEGYGVPLLAPFAPLIGADFRDSLIKESYMRLGYRPQVLRLQNKRRQKEKK